MKKQYSKKRIEEAIAFWKKQLNEFLDPTEIMKMHQKEHPEDYNHELPPWKQPTDMTNKKVVTYAIGNNSHEVPDNSLIYAIYEQYSNAASLEIKILDNSDGLAYDGKKLYAKDSLVVASLVSEQRKSDLTFEKAFKEVKRWQSKCKNAIVILRYCTANKEYRHWSYNPKHRGKTIERVNNDGKLFNMTNMSNVNDVIQKLPTQQFEIHENEMNEMQDQDSDNIMISLKDGMWKATDLESGSFILGASKFANVLQQIQKKRPGANVWANVDGEDVIISWPVAH